MHSKKRFIALLISGILHIMLIILIAGRFDRTVEDFKPTETKGMVVSLMKDDDLPIKPEPQSILKVSDNSGVNTQSVPDAEINLKFSKRQTATKINTANKTSKSVTKPHVTKHAPKPQPITKLKMPVEKIITIAESVVNKPQLELSDTPGGGANANSSTNGNGNKSDAFDFRLIQYSRDAAAAIEQNFYWPQNYKPVISKFRAIVILDRNMQFQNLKVIDSTGMPELDNSIIKALKSTIYPPLPPGADWNQYHIIDYHSSING